MRKRVFIAINLPQNIKEELERLKKELKALFPPELRQIIFREVKKENLHLTLLFIGQIDQNQLIQISQILKEICQKILPFSLRVKKLTYGPPGKIPPRLVWLELEKKKELLNLAQKLKKEIQRVGLLKKTEDREFSPHITLARIRSWPWRRIAQEERPEIEKDLFLEFKVRSIELMESKLKKTGAEYSILESVPL